MFGASLVGYVGGEFEVGFWKGDLGGGGYLVCLGGVFLCNALSRFGINLPYTKVARGVSCFCLYSKLHNLG